MNHVEGQSRGLRVLVRVVGREVYAVAGASKAVHLVGAGLLLLGHLEPTVNGVLHVGGNCDVGLDKPLRFVQLRALQLFADSQWSNSNCIKQA